MKMTLKIGNESFNVYEDGDGGLRLVSDTTSIRIKSNAKFGSPDHGARMIDVDVHPREGYVSDDHINVSTKIKKYKSPEELQTEQNIRDHARRWKAVEHGHGFDRTVNYVRRRGPDGKPIE